MVYAGTGRSGGLELLNLLSLGGVHGSLAGALGVRAADAENGITTSAAECGSDSGFDSFGGKGVSGSSNGLSEDGAERVSSAKIARIALRFSSASS